MAGDPERGEDEAAAKPGNPPTFAGRLGRARWIVPLLLALAVLAPYFQLVAGLAIPIPDDIFISDLVDGDFPVRVEAGRLLRAGELPLWTSRIWTGFPLQVLVTEPFSLALFAALPPALALGWYICLWLLAAALGTYALARRLGASRAGGFLAGFAFAWSGFVVCQLRHLGTLAVVALFPAALLCLERAAGGGLDFAAARALPLRRRLLWLAGFAALFGLQLLAGFPQSAYNAALVYAALVAARCLWLLAPAAGGPGWRAGAAPAAGLAAGALAAVAIGALVGLVQLLPLRELGALSDRSGGGTFEWATAYNYWPRNALTFLVPYANGDISDQSYRGRSIFWEDYGYVGLATVLLALLAAMTRIRRFGVAFWFATGLVAYGLVLGSATPLFRIAFGVVPGLSTFRFPTRFLFIVELALALLGGLGLTALQGLLARHLHRGRLALVAPLVAAALAAGTAADLVYHNRRQNPLVDAGRWLAQPASAAAILATGEPGRVYSPGHRQLHTEAFYRAGGWSGDLGPYIAYREVLQPNANLLRGVASLDGYAGIEPRWTVDLIGDHNRRGIIDQLHRLERGRLQAAPAFFNLLEALSVRWLILPSRVPGGRIEHVASVGNAEVYRLPGALPRARVVGQARIVDSADQLSRLLLSGAIDLRREVALHDPAAAGIVAGLAGTASDPGAAGEARIVVDRANKVVVEAAAPRGGLLLLADTWYPGWEATVDGRPAPVLRANVAHRAVLLPPGNHRIEFTFRPAIMAAGFALSAVGMTILLGAVALLARAKTTTAEGPPAT
jgi:hypothetical protein